MFKYVVVLFQLFGIISMTAQDCSYSVSGVVNSNHEGQGLEHCVVRIKSIKRYITTSHEGGYEIKNLCSGVYEFEISSLGYKTLRKTVEVKEQDLFVNFILDEAVENLLEVSLVHKSFEDSNSGQVTVLDSEIVEENSAGVLGDVLENAKGVSSLKTGATISKPVIHGLHSSRVLIVNNDVRMEDQEWGAEHAPNVDVNTAEKITIIKGASALQFGGDAVGGVVLIEPKKVPVKDTIYGKTIATGATNGRGASLSSNLVKAYKSGVYFKVQGTGKYFGDFQAPDYNLSNTGIHEANYSLTFGINKYDYGVEAFYSAYRATIGILRASHVGNVEDLIIAINSGEPQYIEDFTYAINEPKQELLHRLGKLKYFKNFEDSSKLTFQYGYQLNNRKEFDIRRGDDADLPSMDMELTTHSFDVDYKFQPQGLFDMTVGGSMFYQVNYPDPITGVRRLIPDYRMFSVGFFTLINTELTERVLLDAGVRYDFSRIDAKKFYQKSRWEERGYDEDFSHIIIGDYGSQWLTNPIFDNGLLAASVGVKYRMAPNTLGSVNLSIASRAPNPSEYFSDGLHHSAGAIELGDLRLEKEQSYKFSFSLEGTYRSFEYDVEPFVNKISNYMTLDPSGLETTLRGAFQVWEYNAVEAFLAGVDMFTAYDFSEEWRWETMFSYVYGQDKTRDQPLIHMPAPNFKNTLIYKKKQFNNLKVGISSEFVFEQKRFPDNDFTYSIFDEDGNVVEVEVEISQPPLGYHLLSLSSGMDFKTGKTSNLGVVFSVNNITNTRYRDYLNRQRYYADEQGINFLIQLLKNKQNEK